MSNLSLLRKIEKAMTSYMDGVITGVVLNVYEGHGENPTVSFPYLICYAEDAVPHPDIPPATGIRMVTMRFEVRVDSKDETIGTPRDLLDGWRKDVETALWDIDSIKTAINPPASGPDVRTITDLHVYDVMSENEPSEFEKTDWVEQVVVGVVCQPYDDLTA